MSNIANLFIVGAPKCGTTAWVSYLSSHPEIYFSDAKEPHFFSDDFENFRWVKTANEYSKLFSKTGESAIIGEASVQYLYSNNAAKNIFKYNPDARIIVFLRNQSTFLPSYHNQLLYNCDEDISNFREAWNLALTQSRLKIPEGCREPSFLDYPSVGRFSSQIQRYLNYFDSKNIQVIRYESWTKEPRETYLRLLEFLQLEDDGRLEFDKMHQAKRHGSVKLAQYTQRPSSNILKLAKMLKNITGLERLHIAEKIRKLNGLSGYRNALSIDMKLELDDYYKDEMDRLERLLILHNLTQV